MIDDQAPIPENGLRNTVGLLRGFYASFPCPLQLVDSQRMWG